MQLLQLGLLFIFVAFTEQLSLHGVPLSSIRSVIGEPCPYRPTTQPLPKPLPPLLTDAFETAKNLVINASTHMPGFFMNIVYRGETLLEFGYGAKDLKKPNVPPDANTIFRIGSGTKLFTALALFQAFDLRLITSLDDPLRKYVPEFPQMYYPFGNKNSDITWRQVVCHMAGLPRDAPCAACNESTDVILSRLKYEYLKAKPYTKVYYSNLGFALIGRLLEKFINEKFEYITQNQILSPLGMHDTGFTFTPSVIERMAIAYNSNLTPVTGPPIDLGWLSPAGQMYSTGADLAKFVTFLSQSSTGQNINHTLSADLLREMLLPTFVNPDGKMIWSFPWETNLVHNYLVRKKSGIVRSYASVISVVPELELGVNILWNSIDINPLVVADQVYSVLIPAFVQLLVKLEPPAILPPNVSDYEGHYITDSPNLTSDYDIYYKNGLLVFGGIMALKWLPFLDVDTFQTYLPSHDLVAPLCEVLDFYSFTDSYVIFNRSSDGKIMSFSFPNNYWGVTWTKATF